MPLPPSPWSKNRNLNKESSLKNKINHHKRLTRLCPFQTASQEPMFRGRASLTYRIPPPPQTPKAQVVRPGQRGCLRGVQSWLRGNPQTPTRDMLTTLWESGGEGEREKEKELRCGGSPSKRNPKSFLVPPGTAPEPWQAFSGQPTRPKKLGGGREARVFASPSFSTARLDVFLFFSFGHLPPVRALGDQPRQNSTDHSPENAHDDDGH